MADFILSPNMSLPVPVVGVDPGPDYADNINNSLSIVDGHTHSSGSGVQITPSGLNINSSLTMQNNSITNILSLTFTPQTADPGPFNFYMKGVDFYGEDGVGNVIRFTQSGSLAGAAGTITGLPSGTASASYAAGTFVFQSATSTAANIDGGSFIFRNNTPGSFGLTLQPSSAMSSNYSVTLLPPNSLGSTGVVTYDTSNNMGVITYDQVGENMSSVGANAIAATMTLAGSTSIFDNITSGQPVAVSHSNATSSGLLGIIRGAVDINGNRTLGEGFVGGNPSTGVYTVTFSSSFSGPPVVVASISPGTSGIGAFGYIIQVYSINAGGFTVNITTSGSSPVSMPYAFTFIAIGI